MKTTIIAIAISFAAISASAFAQDDTTLSAVSVESGAHLVIDCRSEHLPSQRAVGGVLETNNGSRIYAERERLMHIAHRECMRGAASVAFVRDLAATPPTLAMNDTTAKP